MGPWGLMIMMVCLAELGKAVVPLYLGEARDEGLPCLIACSDSRLLAWDLQLHFQDIHIFHIKIRHQIQSHTSLGVMHTINNRKLCTREFKLPFWIKYMKIMSL